MNDSELQYSVALSRQRCRSLEPSGVLPHFSGSQQLHSLVIGDSVSHHGTLANVDDRLNQAAVRERMNLLREMNQLQHSSKDEAIVHPEFSQESTSHLS